MAKTRRFFLGTGILAGLAGAFGAYRIREGGRVEALATDPEAERFIYRDGWIEQV